MTGERVCHGGLGLPDHAVGHSHLRGDETEICDEKESGDDGWDIPWAEQGEDKNTRVQDDWQSLEDLGERCRWQSHFEVKERQNSMNSC
jgi:hypothetical protein